MTLPGGSPRGRYLALLGLAVAVGAILLAAGQLPTGDGSLAPGAAPEEDGAPSPDPAGSPGGATGPGAEEGRDAPGGLTVPTDQRYFNGYSYAETEPPTWIPAEAFDPEEHVVMAHEVTRYPAVGPTAAQLDAAWRLYNRSYASAERRGWFDYETGVEDGYTLGTNNHYINTGNRSIYGSWGDVDPGSPPTLLYYDHPHREDEKVLAGFMYHQPIGTDRAGPQVGGPLTVWHYHPIQFSHYESHIRDFIDASDGVRNSSEFFQVMGSDFEDLDDYADRRERTSEMLHVWFIEHPEGPFSTRMSIPPGHVEEPEKMTEDEFKNYTMEAFRRNRRKGEIVDR